MQNEKRLSENFIVELFKSCISNQTVFEVVRKHLDLSYLPEDYFQELWQSITDHFDISNHLPTVGILGEKDKIKKNQKILKLLIEIKKCKIPEVDNILPTFENFIKEVRFVLLYKEVGELWNKSEQDKAVKVLSEEIEKISQFSLKTETYSKVFSDFEQRQEQRKLKEKEFEKKVPLGIHCMDFDTRGGGRVGTSGLLLARSGTGKTTFLRWVAIAASRIGLRVIHFQIEGTEDECMEAYDAAWTGATLEDIEFGEIPKNIMNQVKMANKDMIASKGEIHVVAPEEFGSLYVEDCNDMIEDIEKLYGKVSLVLFDNIELFEVKGRFPNSEMGERKRREAIANKITNIAIQRKVFSLATTQAVDIKPDKYNSPDFVMTRSDISEFKGMVKPFSYFWTWNVTDDQYEAGIGTIFNDKFRRHKSGQRRSICTSMSNSRFYDSSRTLTSFWDINKSVPK